MTGDMYSPGPRRKHSRNYWEARQDCIHQEMQQLLEESHEELGLTEVLEEISTVAKLLECASLLKQPKLRRYLEGRWNPLRGEVERVLLGRSELQSWWDELQECERNLEECLSDPGNARIVLSGTSSFRTVRSTSDSVRSVQAGSNSNSSQELPCRTSSPLGSKGSSESRSSSNSRASTARASSTHVSTPPVNSPPASSST